VSDLDVPELDATNAPSRGDAILIADASPEGEAIAAALRARGFAVTEVTPELLGARVIAEAPRAIVVDVDMPGTLEAVERLRELSIGAQAEIVCLGDPARAAELGATRSSGRAFARPVDVDAVIAAIAAVADPGNDDSFGTIPPPSYALMRHPTSPPMRSSEAPPSEMPSAADPFEMGGILPSLDEAVSAQRILPTQMSPELEQLLEAAEQRVVASSHPSSVPAPGEEHDIHLPADLLASLDEPLDPDDDLGGTGSGSGTGGKRPTTAGGRIGPTDPGTGPGGTRVATDGGRRTPPPPDPGDARAPTITGINALPETQPPGPMLDPPPRAIIAPPSPTGFDDPSWSARDLRAAAPTAHGPPAFTPSPAILSHASPPAHAPLMHAPPMHAPPMHAPAPMPAPAPAPVIPAYAPPPVIHAPPMQVAPPSVDSARLGATDLSPPVLLGEGDAVRALARAVAARTSGSLALGPETAMRRIVLRDGDVVTAGSAAEDETLVAFLIARGDLERDAAARLAGKLPPFGRHAGAALIAHGYLGQDDLWPVLRAHAEWIIGRALLESSGACELEAEPPGRLRAEPGVFGGATGAEVLVEAVRRVVPPDVALRRLGGPGARLDDGTRPALLGECALRREEEAVVRNARGRTVGELLQGGPPELCDVLYALVSLGVLDALAPVVQPAPASAGGLDPLDEEAIRARVRARMSLVEDGDYFALLGVAHAATGYEIRRAYLELRRAFEPARVLTGATADLAGDVKTIIEVLDEAYDILREPHRRDRYRRAIEAGPP
jgi:CheY-like chemotaxis protein